MTNNTFAPSSDGIETPPAASCHAPPDPRNQSVVDKSGGAAGGGISPWLDLRLADCMDVMKGFPDGYFDLAIVDPPYGIGMDGRKGSTAKNPAHSWKRHEKKSWDAAAPGPEYFAELRRVSKHQIIWGANYMTENLPPSRFWVFWDKGQDLTMPDGELAWGSMEKPIRRVIFNRCEAREDGIIHPTQKPVKLYAWLLANYAKPGMRVLDTHMGSGSIAIAAHYAGIHLTACEIDPDYFEAAKERIIRETAQADMFSNTPNQIHTQEALL